MQKSPNSPVCVGAVVAFRFLIAPCYVPEIIGQQFRSGTRGYCGGIADWGAPSRRYRAGLVQTFRVCRCTQAVPKRDARQGLRPRTQLTHTHAGVTGISTRAMSEGIRMMYSASTLSRVRPGRWPQSVREVAPVRPWKPVGQCQTASVNHDITVLGPAGRDHNSTYASIKRA